MQGQCLPIAGGGCSAATCAGCCQGTTCVAQVNNSACGKGGSACQACQPGVQCNPQTGACGNGPPPPPACNASNCQGCCQGNNCIKQQSDGACGFNGGACLNCIGSGATCNQGTGQCVGGTGCGPGNCKGCCNGTQCVPAPTDTLCGKNGEFCQNCSGGGSKCDTNTGQCIGGTGCNAANCGGCCRGGVCQPLNDANCGLQGATCNTCSAAQGTRCNFSTGQCEQIPQGNCNSQNCANGCCNGGACVAASNTACGANGAACAPCGANQECVSGQCKNKQAGCGPGSCSGCCFNGVCVEANQVNDRKCGAGGNACANCASTQHCDGTPKACKTKPAPSYPPGKYGSSVGSTISNTITLSQCDDKGKRSTVDIFNDKSIKVVFLAAATGW